MIRQPESKLSQPPQKNTAGVTERGQRNKER